jgi:hypothetical protein
MTTFVDTEDTSNDCQRYKSPPLPQLEVLISEPSHKLSAPTERMDLLFAGSYAMYDSAPK